MSEEMLITDPDRQEKVYKDASGLLESVSYIIRFERKTTILNNAARKFRKLGDYKDSKEKAKICQEAAQKAEEEGCKESFAKALQKEKEAKFKSDFVDTIEEFKRTWNKEDYAEEGKKHIAYCKEQIIRLEKKATAKRRWIVLGVFVVLCLIFWRTPGYPFAKGMVHQKMGNYRKALANYELAGSLPGVAGQKNICYYELAQKALEKGNDTKALKLLKKTVDYDEAEKLEWKLEKKLIKNANFGSRVLFGDCRWTIADKTDTKALLVYSSVSRKSIYSREKQARWRDSEVFQWLNTTFVSAKFSETEIKNICEQYTGKKASGTLTPERVFVLNTSEYQKYQKNIIPVKQKYWLREEGTTQMSGTYVSDTGDVKKTYVNDMMCYIRPAVWVSLNK